jgi:hypothetical protein
LEVGVVVGPWNQEFQAWIQEVVAGVEEEEVQRSHQAFLEAVEAAVGR